MNTNLVQEFDRIRGAHAKATRWAVARTVLAPSVTRVFTPGTRNRLLPVLAKLPIEELKRLGDEDGYKAWFERQLDGLTEALREGNQDNPRVQPGLQWGHGTKILCIFVAGTVLWSRTFNDPEVSRIRPWLFVPIDGKIMARLRQLGVKPEFWRIREIDTPEKFYGVQTALSEAAREAGVARIWFDDVWAVE